MMGRREKFAVPEILGLHHVTAIAGEPQQNLDFYAGFLCLRLVKLTVNYSDPEPYHLYFGDDLGHPGTILTFFPWPGAPKGRKGSGQLVTTSFSIPEGSVAYWAERLEKYGVKFTAPTGRFQEEVISFSDPDGLDLELVAHHRRRLGTAGTAGRYPRSTPSRVSSASPSPKRATRGRRLSLPRPWDSV